MFLARRKLFPALGELAGSCVRGVRAAFTASVVVWRCVQLILLIARQRFAAAGDKLAMAQAKFGTGATLLRLADQASGAARDGVLTPLIVRSGVLDETAKV